MFFTSNHSNRFQETQYQFYLVSLQLVARMRTVQTQYRLRWLRINLHASRMFSQPDLQRIAGQQHSHQLISM
jgi:hypothetical protein